MQNSNQIDALVASETNRLILRSGASRSVDAQSRSKQFLNTMPASHSASLKSPSSNMSTAEALAPGIVGAVAFFLVMFALVAAYWRCGRFRDNSPHFRKRRRTRPWEAAAAESDDGGCRITVNPLEEEIEMKPSLPKRVSLQKPIASDRCSSIAEDNNDFDDLASLLSSSDGSGSCSDNSESSEDDEVDENCEQCRREARLASPEEAEEESDVDDAADSELDDDGIEFADEDSADDAANDDAPAKVETESARLIRGRGY